MDDTALIDEIHSLLAAPPTASGGPTLADLEEVLTAGYARALTLEAERWRLERRIGEIAVELANGDGPRRADEIAALAHRMSAADVDILRLRTALASLRDRASDARAA